ncbi:polysaccharide deacetylase family protein [Clostridium botulinum]|uniref:polysaccharide deacetylase family protein n=1 Tax=Clostridium botulinum TaxID=1491 RepID=UPI003DA498C7
MTYIYYNNNSFYKQIEYVFSTIFNILGIKIKYLKTIQEVTDEYGIVINYSDEILHIENVINIKPSYLFKDMYLKIESMPRLPLKKYKDFPVIYCANEDEPYVINNGNNIITNIDIVQSIFFMLTRYEEVLLWDEVEKDIYGRFPAKESLAYKEGFLNLPIVNEYIEWLWQWIDSFNLGDKRRNLWGKYDFAACLTHDVDMPFKYIYPLKKDIQNLKVKKASLAYRDIFLHALSAIDYKKDPFYTFDYIRKIEKKYNFTSSFYFMTGGTSNYENFYSIDDERVLHLMDILYSQNCEVGYHYSFNSYNDFSQRKKEKDLLDKHIPDKIYGGRNHYLRFKAPESWRISEKIGILYDTTLSYADYDGFRCGIAMPFKPFDISENRELDIYEIPLIVMEGTLKDRKYMNLNIKDAINEIKGKIDTVRKYKGVFTFLWHNSSFDKENWNEWKTVFENTMEYLAKNNAVGISGKQVINKF